MGTECIVENLRALVTDIDEQRSCQGHFVRGRLYAREDYGSNRSEFKARMEREAADQDDEASIHIPYPTRNEFFG